MKLAIFDVGQTLAINEESYEASTLGCARKLFPKLLQALRDNQEALLKEGVPLRVDEEYASGMRDEFQGALASSIISFKEAKN